MKNEKITPITFEELEACVNQNFRPSAMLDRVRYATRDLLIAVEEYKRVILQSIVERGDVYIKKKENAPEKEKIN